MDDDDENADDAELLQEEEDDDDDMGDVNWLKHSIIVMRWRRVPDRTVDISFKLRWRHRKSDRKSAIIIIVVNGIR